MEYLTKAHAALARPHMQEIQRRITELKESAASYVSAHGTAQPDDSGELISQLIPLKLSNLFAAQRLLESLCSSTAVLPPLTEFECLHQLAEISLCLGPLSKAVQLAEELCKKVAFLEMPAEAQFRAEILLGHAHRATNSIAESRNHYQKAEHLARNSSSLTPDHELLAFIYQQICTYATGKNDEALSRLKPPTENTSLSKFTEEDKNCLYHSHSEVVFYSTHACLLGQHNLVLSKFYRTLNLLVHVLIGASLSELHMVL